MMQMDQSAPLLSGLPSIAEAPPSVSAGDPWRVGRGGISASKSRHTAAFLVTPRESRSDPQFTWHPDISYEPIDWPFSAYSQWRDCLRQPSNA